MMTTEAPTIRAAYDMLKRTQPKAAEHLQRHQRVMKEVRAMLDAYEARQVRARLKWRRAA